MKATLFALSLAALVSHSSARADEWRVQHIDTPARVNAIDAANGDVRIRAGGL